MGKKKAVRSVPAQIVIGSAAELGFMLALTAVMAALVLGGAIGQGSIRTAALCANTLAAFLGSLLAAKGFLQRRLPMTLLSVGGYLLLLLLGNLLFVGAAPTDGLAVCLPPIGAAARQPEAEDEAQAMMQENLQTAKE